MKRKAPPRNSKSSHGNKRLKLGEKNNNLEEYLIEEREKSIAEEEKERERIFDTSCIKCSPFPLIEDERKNHLKEHYFTPPENLKYEIKQIKELHSNKRTGNENIRNIGEVNTISTLKTTFCPLLLKNNLIPSNYSFPIEISKELNTEANHKLLNFSAKYIKYIEQNKSRKRLKYEKLDVFLLLSNYIDLTYNFWGGDELPNVDNSVTNIATSKDNCHILRPIIFHILNHLGRRREEISKNDDIYIQDKEYGDIVDIRELAKNYREDEGSEKDQEESSDTEPDIKSPKINPPLISDFTKEVNIVNMREPQRESESVEDRVKDQGFNKTKILILTAFKQGVLDIVNELILLYAAGKWKGVSKRKKFREEYGSQEFGDDYFRIGISFYNNKIKLYSQFDKSDIIIASPLGLRTVIGESGENEINRNYDFLSSIEIIFLYKTHLFLYQNLSHLEDVLKLLNIRPHHTSGVNDINRLLPQYLTNQNKYYTQTISLQKFSAPLIAYLGFTYAYNYKGGLTKANVYPGFMKNLLFFGANKLRVTFKRTNNLLTATVNSSEDERFKYFTQKIWNKMYDGLSGYTILFVQNYFDFLQIKKFFKYYIYIYIYLGLKTQV